MEAHTANEFSFRAKPVTIPAIDPGTERNKPPLTFLADPYAIFASFTCSFC